jgi:hypothetical protein
MSISFNLITIEVIKSLKYFKLNSLFIEGILTLVTDLTALPPTQNMTK